MHRYDRNEINTVKQLNYLTNIHIDTMIYKYFVITIKLNTLTDVPYQMTVGGAFVYVRGRVNDEQRSHVYTVVR